MKKMDEMERQTNASGIKWAWAFLVLALGIWTGTELFKGAGLPLAGVLLIGQFLVYFIVTATLKRRLGDTGATSSLLLFAIIAVAAVGFGFLSWLV